ncbi:hypothetical protein [Pedobacter sp.]|uniref:hypothetical protein n=1 Tax=Pedobacter sp. TaxID=1411316 RepID=UPI003D7F309A
MNSLSTFENCKNPLKSYIQHVSRNLVTPENIQVESSQNGFKILLPNGQCYLEVTQQGISVTRKNFDFEKFSQYRIESIIDAKLLTGILSGVCHEYGCSFMEANNTVYLTFRLFDQLKSNYS